MDPFIPCSLKTLHPDIAIAGAEEAIRQNPANEPSKALALTGMILLPEHLALLTQKFWGNNGIKLTVNFMEPVAPALRDRILSHMNAWNQYCNAVFVYSTVSPQVRITLAGDGYWSYLGTDILSIPQSQPTMCLQAFSMSTPESEYRRVVRHETGHTMGFPHEHMRPEIVNAIDPQKAIAYFGQTQGWTPQEVVQQVLTPLNPASIRATATADRKGIMCYALPGSIMRDGQPVPGGNDIDELDQSFSASLYPLEIINPPPPKPPGPPVAVGDVTMALSLDKKSIVVSAPSGWTLGKKSSDTGDIEMTPSLRSCSPSDMQQWANELEACLPSSADDRKAMSTDATLGGTISKVIKLIADLRASDWTAVIADIQSLLTDFLSSVPAPTGGGGGGVITFQMQVQQHALGSKINWGLLSSILLKILPIILGATGA